eukprot:gene95-biopygen224
MLDTTHCEVRAAYHRFPFIDVNIQYSGTWPDGGKPQRQSAQFLHRAGRAGRADRALPAVERAILELDGDGVPLALVEQLHRDAVLQRHGSSGTQQHMAHWSSTADEEAETCAERANRDVTVQIALA